MIEVSVTLKEVRRCHLHPYSLLLPTIYDHSFTCEILFYHFFEFIQTHSMSLAFFFFSPFFPPVSGGKAMAGESGKGQRFLRCESNERALWMIHSIDHAIMSMIDAEDPISASFPYNTLPPPLFYPLRKGSGKSGPLADKEKSGIFKEKVI